MKIKICGITAIEETAYLNQNHVDFAGMILFFPKSRRNITLEQAQLLIQALDPAIKKTAVVVSPTLEQALALEALHFDYIQIHGDLSQDLLQGLHTPILKAFNVSDMHSYPYYHRFPQIAGYVFDAAEPGSGKTFDWSLVKNIPRDEKLLLLAGGLTPDNVTDAIRFIHPDGVDVSSGVEYGNKPGKDPEKVAAFTQAVRSIL